MIKLRTLFLLACLSCSCIVAQTDSTEIRLLKEKVKKVEVRQAAMRDSVSNFLRKEDSLSKLYYVVDKDALRDFNTKKDSIYKASYFWFVKCRHTGAGCRGPVCRITPKHDCFTHFSFWSGIIIFALVWYLAIYYFKTSRICRAESNLPLKEAPYSYSRVQLFWWTLIILSLYIYFFAFTGMLLPLNMTAVILLGSGVLVYSGGKMIDKKQNIRLGKIPSHPSEGFLFDILSDENDVNIHRFQSVIFNLVYGVGYVLLFLKNTNSCLYPFPEFSGWQFALLGISSVTYLGLKATENDPAKATPEENVVKGDKEEPTVRDIHNH